MFTSKHCLRRWGALLGAGAALSWANTSAASPIYPPLLASSVETLTGKRVAAPLCTLCHASLAGGRGTVVSSFGKSMQGFGLRGSDPASLDAALKSDLSEGWDSDGDGISDLDELVAGSDPNDGPGPVEPQPIPLHGCSLRATAPSDAEGGAASTLLLLVAAAFTRRARRWAGKSGRGALPGSA